jgi:hypothetical protein
MFIDVVAWHLTGCELVKDIITSIAITGILFVAFQFEIEAPAPIVVKVQLRPRPCLIKTIAE